MENRLRTYELLCDNVLDLLYLCDTQGNILFVNKVFERLTGYRCEDFIGKSFAPLFGGEDLKLAMDAYNRTLEGESPVYVLSFKKTGIPCEFKNIPFRDESGNIVGVYGSARDITERRRAEQAIKAERDMAQKYLEIAGVIFVVIYRNERVTLINRKGCEILGYKREEVIGRNWFDNFLPDDGREEVRKTFRKLVAGELEPVEYYENDVLTKDGGRRLVAWHNTLLKDADGSVTATLSSGTDITELATATDELNRYKANLEAIFRSVRDGIITVGMDLTVIELNEAAERICALSRDSIGKRFDKLLCNTRCIEALKKTISEKKPVELERFEFNIEPDRNHVISVNIQPFIDSTGAFSGAVMVMRDETRLVGLERDLKARKQFSNIIGASGTLQEIYSLIEDLADIDTTVLITGESGTGKELVAEALHNAGHRGNGPFVKVNCSALSDTLLESELFGHVKGAFTGAVADRVGRFELADGGTIFLDEIGDISGALQQRLLRVLQNREFERLGESKTLKVDIRVIAATNTDLLEKVASGEFREDLFYRLKVVEVCMPPLRDRLEDLPLLLEHFLARYNEKFNRNILGVSEDVQKLFMSYSWPGNIRELEHAIEHAFIVCREKTIMVEHLPQGLRSGGGGARERFNNYGYYKNRALDECDEIVTALKKTGWNKAEAARRLGMSRRTIYRKMEKYNIGSKP